MGRRILVTGSRAWRSRAIIRRALSEFAVDDNVLVSGGASGADLIAEEEWRALGMPEGSIERHLPDWDSFGKRAGYIRNTQMASLGAYICLAFHTNCPKRNCRRKPKVHLSHGTTHMIKAAETAGIEVKTYFQ